MPDASFLEVIFDIHSGVSKRRVSHNSGKLGETLRNRTCVVGFAANCFRIVRLRKPTTHPKECDRNSPWRNGKNSCEPHLRPLSSREVFRPAESTLLRHCHEVACVGLLSIPSIPSKHCNKTFSARPGKSPSHLQDPDADRCESWPKPAAGHCLVCQHPCLPALRHVAWQKLRKRKHHRKPRAKGTLAHPPTQTPTPRRPREPASGSPP